MSLIASLWRKRGVAVARRLTTSGNPIREPPLREFDGAGLEAHAESAMASILITGVGTAAALCSMGSFVPQVVKIWRERDASGVSLRMYAVTVTGFALWIAYGVSLQSWPLVGSNAVCLLLSAAILALKWRFGDRSPDAAKASG